MAEDILLFEGQRVVLWRDRSWEINLAKIIKVRFYEGVPIEKTTKMKYSICLRCSAASVLFAALACLQAHAQTELIVNGGFESGGSSWVMTGGAGVYTDSGYARSGTGFQWLGGAVNEVDAAYQTVAIPANATSATLSFYYNIFSVEDPAPFDTFTATVRNTSGTILATVVSKSNVDEDPGVGPAYYHQQTFNLLPYAGQTIRIQFVSANDSINETSFLIDDVSVQVTAVSVPPTNDTCSGAIAMTAGTTYTLNTASATATGDPTPGCQGSFGKGVWYSYTPSAIGNVTISTCGSSFDTVLAVYTGTCGALTPVACNDDNGPSCASSQASLTFSATGGTTYLVMAGGSGGASGNLNILASGPGGLTIVPTFASSITSDAQAATIQATINAALAVYQNNFSDSTIVTITFQEMGSGLGQSSTYISTFGYLNYRAALLSHATTADDAIAVASLPNVAGNPVNGNSSLKLTLPLARTLGFSANTPPGQTDATISLNTSLMNLSLSTTNPSKYSLFAVACHEIDEVLGMGSVLNGLNNGDPTPTGPASPEDLFRYDATGARSLTTAANAASYFSLNGTTNQVRFNQQQGGDFQDWYSYPSGAPTPRVQDAFSTPGASPVPNVELTVLDVLGYTRIIAPRPSLSLIRSGTNVVIAWPTSFTGFTLQSVSNVNSGAWATVTNAAVIANGKFNVTNAPAGTRRFYRLVK